MRIRKRQVPFPLSSLSPVPLSDPHLSRSPVVQLQLNHYPHLILYQEDDTAEYFNPPSSSDQQNQPIGVGSSSRHPEYLISNQDTKDCPKDERGREVGEGERSNDTRGSSFLGAKTDSLHEPSNSLQQVGRWCEGEKAFPLKKRRGNFERKSNEETSLEKDKKMKTKMNKKYLQRNGNNQEIDKEIKEGGGVNASGVGTAKKKGRGGALMEGSRCSRVNGRGWRCCQQTLVGYSLCEHHLGKGRLRSMTSVRSRSIATATTTKKAAVSSILPLSSSEEEDKQQMKHVLPDNKLLVGTEDDEGDHEKKPLSKRKTKLGIVKARSISSLLGQESNAITSVAENNN